jgi:chromosome segregation ATPase
MTELSQEEKLNAFLDKLHADLEKKKSELAAFLKEIERILALIAENEAKCLVIENTLTVTIPENIKALEAERDRHLAVLAELNAKLAVLAEELNVLKEKKKVIEDKAAGVKTQILALEAEIAGMEGTVDSLYLSDDSPDHKANDEINKHFAIRDEIRARVKAHEDDIRRDRNTYDAVLISLANLEKAISLNERHIFKQNQIIETLEAEFALEKCTVDALQVLFFSFFVHLF